MAGPLGKAAELGEYDKVLGIGGGVGAAPLYPQLKKIAKKGALVDVILGGRTAELVILENEFKAFSHSLTAVTDDGSYGMKALWLTPF